MFIYIVFIKNVPLVTQVDKQTIEFVESTRNQQDQQKDSTSHLEQQVVADNGKHYY